MRKRNFILFFLLAIVGLFILGGLGIWNLRQRVDQDIQDIQKESAADFTQVGYLDTLQSIRSKIGYLEAHTEALWSKSLNPEMEYHLLEMADSVRELNNIVFQQNKDRVFQDSLFFYTNKRLEAWRGILLYLDKPHITQSILSDWPSDTLLTSEPQVLTIPDSILLEDKISPLKWVLSKKYRKNLANKRKESVDQVLSEWREILTPEKDDSPSIGKEEYSQKMEEIQKISEKKMVRFVRLFYESEHYAKKMDFYTRKIEQDGNGIILARHMQAVKEQAGRSLNQTITHLFNLLLILGTGICICLFLVGINHHMYRRQLNKREAFVSKVTHEIKNALHPIIGFAATIDENLSQSSIRGILGTVKEESQHLMYLANGILDLSKIKRNEFSLGASPFVLQEALNQVIGSHRLEATEKAIELNARFSPDLPKVVIGDPERLKQIVRNVLTNAIKHTDQGQVLMEVSLAKNRKKKVHILMAIIDTGKGLSRKNLRRISRFRQFNSLGEGGFGLGLAISHQLIRQHKGKIKIRSKGIDKGLHVFITLPYVKGHLQDVLLLPSQKPVSKASLSEFSILLVDDDRLNLELTSTWLKNRGAAVHTAENGIEAQELMGRISPELILLDRQMPEMDGKAFMNWLRNEKQIHTPVILCSGNGLNDIQKEREEMDVNGLMAKPYSRDELLGKVSELLQLNPKDSIREPVEQEESQEPAKAEKIYAIQKLKQEIGENPGEILKKIRLLTEVCKECLPQLYQGIQAEDAKLIQRAVHKMLMICRYLGKNMEENQADLETRTQEKKLSLETLALSLRFYHLVRIEVDKLDSFLKQEEKE